jgi:hypothetical protein
MGLSRIHYAGQVLEVATDLAEMISVTSTEFANDGRTIAVPVACYLQGVPSSAQMIIGQGIPILITDLPFADQREDPPDTLLAWAWIRDELEGLQAEQ